MRTVGWFLVVVGLAIASVWTLLLGSGQVPEMTEGRIDIVFHLAAEALTATLLVAAGAGLLRGWPRAPLTAAVAIGALAYTSVNSAGYYAESGDWPAVTMFVVVAVGTALAGRRVLRRDRPGERRDVPGRDPGGSAASVNATRSTLASRRAAGRAARTRWLVGLLVFQGLGALGGGLTFLLDRSGRLAGLSPQLLARTPFDDFLWPGLLLALGLGVPAVVLAVAILRRPAAGPLAWVERLSGHHWSWAGSIALGAGLMAWIVVQVWLIEVSWLQPLMFAVGAALVVLPLTPSVRRELPPSSHVASTEHVGAV